MSNFEELENRVTKAMSDYLRNEEPYKSSIEERSGFTSGVEWALKKLRKWGVLNAVEVVSFNTQQDMFVGERFFGHVKSDHRSDRISGKLLEVQIVCVDDLHPGWLNVKALASEVKREGDGGDVGSA